MPPFTRRRALRTAAGLTTGLAAALAGCGAESRDSPTPTVAARPGKPNADASPPTYRLRAAAPDPLVWLRDETTEDGGATPENHRNYLLVDSRSRADRVEFAAVDGRDGARRFIDETDFSSESVWVEGFSVPECYRRELCYVAWSRDEIETSYARQLRPYDAACSADAEDAAAVLIRLPAALDHEQLRGYGSSVSSGECHVPERLRNGTETAATEADR
ncbi:hypothetical protein [Halobaculum sp. D14]|uniref:hypothetical protein n=1 Tax=Halobaculum sp. D14 TaxID=3421642 RepID=UPI003EB80EF7